MWVELGPAPKTIKNKKIKNKKNKKREIEK